jgi:hypothetical protein
VEIVAVLPSPFFCSCRLAIETQLSERIVFCLVDGDTWSSGSPGLIPPGGAQTVHRPRHSVLPGPGHPSNLHAANFWYLTGTTVTTTLTNLFLFGNVWVRQLQSSIDVSTLRIVLLYFIPMTQSWSNWPGPVNPPHFEEGMTVTDHRSALSPMAEVGCFAPLHSYQRGRNNQGFKGPPSRVRD